MVLEAFNFSALLAEKNSKKGAAAGSRSIRLGAWGCQGQ